MGAALSQRGAWLALRSLVCAAAAADAHPGGARRGDPQLRMLRLTAAEIAEMLSMALATVSRWLKRIGLGKRSRLEPPEPPHR